MRITFPIWFTKIDCLTLKVDFKQILKMTTTTTEAIPEMSTTEVASTDPATTTSGITPEDENDENEEEHDEEQVLVKFQTS